MRSAGGQLARLVNKSAVPYVAARQSFSQAFAPPAPMRQELKSMGSVGTLFAIVTKLANGTSQVEWDLWRKSKDGTTEGRVQVTNHLALSIWDRPNDFFTRQELVEVTGQHQELVGEQWWVISRDPRSALPLELWPVRPDRMRPVPDANDFLVGYIYTGPQGEEIPLTRDQVIMMRSPDPESAYRGMGPVQTILPDLTATNMAAQWVANFFTNSAQPGGIIEVEKRLSDEEFDEMTARWREQHQGVANAHRVAVLEQGKYVSTAFNMRDMQFNELRSSNSEIIREAFGFPKPMLGSTDDVNRANAEAAEYVFAKWLIVPRLQRIKEALNNDFLPLFYPKGVTPDVEFDYCDPVPENEEFEATERKSKADTLKVYVDLGFAVPDVLQMLDLPDLPYVKPAPPPPPVLPAAATPPAGAAAPADPGADPPAAGVAANLAPSRHRPWPTMKADLPDVDHPDLTGVQVSWEQHLDDLIRSWTDITTAQKDDLIAQIHDVVSSGTPTDLLAVEAAADAGAAVLQQALISVGQESAEHVVEEADAQGETINPVPPRRETLIGAALVTTGLIAAGLGFSAVREAQRVWNPASTAADVARLVRAQLDTLSDAGPRAQLGAALTRAQRDGRINTLRAAPTTAWYASEQLDRNTCLAPEALVSTDRGLVAAQDVKRGDLLLTHSGRWVTPSHRMVTGVSEHLVTIRLANGSALRLTADHAVLTSGNEWRQAGKLTVGDLVVSEETLERGGEIVPPDLDLTQTPHGVSAFGQVRSLPRVDVWAQGVPVGAVRFDHQVTDHEVDGPSTGTGLWADVKAQALQNQTDDPLDAGFGTAGQVAASSAKPAGAHRAGDDTERRTAVAAVEQRRRAAADLGAIGPVHGPAVPEQGTAPLASRGPAACCAGAGLSAVGVSAGVGRWDAECDSAVGADLVDPIWCPAELGQQFGVGELTRAGAVDGPGFAPAGDHQVADLAEPGRVAGGPPCSCGAGSAARGSTAADPATAVTTQCIHHFSVLEVVAIDRAHYAGPVYDFTVPGDETFWAGGILVHNCKNCRAINGKWLGNSVIENVNRLYPTGGYVDCLGRDRCRGMVVGVWRPTQVGDT